MTSDQALELLYRWQEALFRNAYAHYRFADHKKGLATTISLLSIIFGVIAFVFSISDSVRDAIPFDDFTNVFAVLVSSLYLTMTTAQAYFRDTETYFHHKQAGTDASDLRRKIEILIAKIKGGQFGPPEKDEIQLLSTLYSASGSNAPLLPNDKYVKYTNEAMGRWAQYYENSSPPSS